MQTHTSSTMLVLQCNLKEQNDTLLVEWTQQFYLLTTNELVILAKENTVFEKRGPGRGKPTRWPQLRNQSGTKDYWMMLNCPDFSITRVSKSISHKKVKAWTLHMDSILDIVEHLKNAAYPSDLSIVLSLDFQWFLPIAPIDWNTTAMERWVLYNSSGMWHSP